LSQLKARSRKIQPASTPEGFDGEVINQNAWLDETSVMQIRPGTEKLYDAIYVGRRSAFKRQMLAAKVPNLALVAGNNHGNAVAPLPPAAYLNDAPLTPDEVCTKLNQSRCGLILSAEEGACFASGEYLLCGLPVVSTPSKGGRHLWYNDYNAIICDPTPEAVAASVEHFLRYPRDPERIRAMHVAQAAEFRARFVVRLQGIFDRFGVTEDAGRYFRETYMHKLRRSYRPDFEALFGPGA
jgi:hypothetical protein